MSSIYTKVDKLYIYEQSGNLLKSYSLEAIFKDYKVKLVTLGWDGFQFDGSAEKHEWVPIFDYPQKLASLNLDIAIVPLVDSAYNRCKSNIAFLE